MLQFINKVEIQGAVGFGERHYVSGNAVDLFSVCVNYALTSQQGMPVIETTWFQVHYYGGDPSKPSPKKGDWVKVEGRLRAKRYTSADTGDMVMYDIVANSVEIINEDKDDEKQ